MIHFWHYLRSWWQPRSRVRFNVVLYTRSRCPLCDEAKAFLAREQSRLRFALREVDIDTSDELRLRYANSVPVTEVNGKERFRGAIQPMLWRRLLHALQSEG